MDMLQNQKNKVKNWLQNHKEPILKNAKGAGGAIVILATCIVATIVTKDEREFDKWVKTASDDELSDGYEIRRQQWAKEGFGGDGEKTPEMIKINNEIGRRSAEKWANDPRRNTDPNYRWTDANRWDKD